MRTALVFGGSGQVGQPLLARLHDAGWRIHAVSRADRIELPGVHWLRGNLDDIDGLPASVDAIFSCGPLDHFARWHARDTVKAHRVVAFGSTSVDVKRDSLDAAERELAARLAHAERSLFASGAELGAAVTVLRPTLVYGSGADQSLARIAALARRWGRFVLPRRALGLRQPVHVRDLADAAFAVAPVAATHGMAYAVPGGESLSYREMVARVLAVLEPPVPLLEVPGPVFASLLHGAQMAGHARGFGPAGVARMRRDLVFDATPARVDFGYAPRAFKPTAAMFRQ